MATRSTITIKTPWKSVHLYRHWDGYPECNGRFLARAMRHQASIFDKDLTIALLCAKESEPFAAGNYELTEQANRHGDTEWHYRVTMAPREEAIVTVYNRAPGGDFKQAFHGRQHEYRKWIAKRLREFIARCKARAA